MEKEQILKLIERVFELAREVDCDEAGYGFHVFSDADAIIEFLEREKEI